MWSRTPPPAGPPCASYKHCGLITYCGGMSYEKASGSVWQGLLADGTVDMARVAQKFKKQHGDCKLIKKHYHTIISATLNDTYKQNRTKTPSSVNVEDDALNNLQCCEPIYDCMSSKPVCETYVLSANNKNHSSTIPSKTYASAVIEELKDAEPNRFVIITLSNCNELEECSKKVLAEIGFTPHPKQAYHHYRKFSNAARKLIEDSITYFEAPCCRLFEHLKQQGFKGDHDTYA